MASVTISCNLAASDGVSSIGQLKTSWTELELFAGANMHQRTDYITTTPAALTLTGIDTSKDFRLKIFNKSSTVGENILVSTDGGTLYPTRIPYGEPHLWNTLVGGVASVYIKSEAGTVEYEVSAVEFEA